ncbi:type II inositol 1,4,5-trisphosphate 5-phosphatase [Condylostylus longicornis]|uniref:type II inositol 1,4,5-trisphosphate 5-phosphatase n=1 Tax=Condylostylus longicornis TaxID=2530218 RepID=UPI00244DB99E|nr:type II inositol 1,4,5-trisphosphate 5-phosphatase [Condylostylus longicornis]
MEKTKGATFFTTSATEVDESYFSDTLNKTNIPNAISGASNKLDNKFMDLTMEVLQEKFKRGEIVLAALDAYQVIANEMADRLLALVSSTGTYGIFSFATTRLPPRTFSDLTIDCIYAINDDFQLITDVKGKISNLQFELVTTCSRAKFSYYITSMDVFNLFYSKVQSAQLDYKSRKQKEIMNNAATTGVVLSPTTVGAISNSEPQTISFSWLESYRTQDYTAIDRYIADGSKPLKKGESKFQDELKKHEHEYIVFKNYRIYCATWNINGQPCNDDPLKAWLAATDLAPDIYAVALQEMDLSPKAVTFSESRPDPIWIRKFKDNLHSDAQYEELTSVRLVGMMLSIFVKKELRQNVIRYSTQSVGTGALNFMGNKGGVAVSLTLNEARICFVNSHLAAHMNEIERRNRDYSEIMRYCLFSEHDGTKKSIEDHDHIFWIGDLNYRITEYTGIALNYNDNTSLFKFDQLRREMAEYNVFKGFTEGKINFRPTYKYDPGTDNWDSSEKNRAPAWCDRILWKGDKIEQLIYNSVMEIRMSDHKPVYAIFSTGIKTKDEKKYKRIHEEVLKRVDKYENDNQPQITVEKTDIDFDIVTFNEPMIRDFTVANNCHLPVKFSFKPKSEVDKKKICEDWLTVEPQKGHLITGTSLSIRIKLTVDSRFVNHLHNKQKNSVGKIPLDILVLHVEDGRDIFITIMGEYKASCFGFSVETLCRIERPIAEYTFKELMEIENSVESSQCKVTMPREIFLLIDNLYNNYKNVPLPLFTIDRKYYLSPNINEIRDWLDTWSTLEFPGTLPTTAEALLMILESPEKPLLYPYEEAFMNEENFECCIIILNKLSTPRKNVFLHISMFLRELIEQKMVIAGDIATIFGNILLKGKYTPGMRDDRCKIFMSKWLRSDFTNLARNHIVF